MSTLEFRDAIRDALAEELRQVGERRSGDVEPEVVCAEQRADDQQVGLEVLHQPDRGEQRAQPEAQHLAGLVGLGGRPPGAEPLPPREQRTDRHRRRPPDRDRVELTRAGRGEDAEHNHVEGRLHEPVELDEVIAPGTLDECDPVQQEHERRPVIPVEVAMSPR